MSRAGSWTGTAHSGQNSLIFQPEHKDTTRETKAYFFIPTFLFLTYYFHICRNLPSAGMKCPPGRSTTEQKSYFMIPKTIHLCWFSDDPFPVEIKICLDSWKKILPDFRIRRWTYEDARSIGCRFINEALEAKKWAFAADVVRFYAIYKEGGIYMDSDILLKKRFDRFIPEKGFATFHEHIGEQIRLQAAFFMGEKGNAYCKDVFEYYNSRPFRKPDGSLDMTISPVVMLDMARRRGYRTEDTEQHLADDIVIYPGHYVTPCKHIKKHPDAFALHTIYGSWRKRKLGRRIELFCKHQLLRLRYLFRH